MKHNTIVLVCLVSSFVISTLDGAQKNKERSVSLAGKKRKPQDPDYKKLQAHVFAKKVKTLINHSPRKLPFLLKENNTTITQAKVNGETLYALAIRRANQAWITQQTLKNKIIEEAQKDDPQCYICQEKTKTKEKAKLDISPCCNQIACKECIQSYKESDAPKKDRCPLCKITYDKMTVAH